MEFKIPQSLTSEHQELHSELEKATKIGGYVGDAAKVVAKMLHPHFVREEECALRPLGLLPLLAKGEISPDMEEALSMTDRLKVELSQMLEEHKSIVSALKGLSFAATKANKKEIAEFAEKLRLHARTEEEVLYPTTILIGEYLKIKLKK
jgi:Hemerythrin HHE cation binding domain